jgi:hypothetical protein
MVATLEGSGSPIDKIVDVQCFLIDMKRDSRLLTRYCC